MLIKYYLKRYNINILFIKLKIILHKYIFYSKIIYQTI